jgi:hypothetical protein
MIQTNLSELKLLTVNNTTKLSKISQKINKKTQKINSMDFFSPPPPSICDVLSQIFVQR